MNRLEQLNGVVEKLAKDNNEVLNSFGNFSKAVQESGPLDVKTQELILIALGLGVQCEWCISAHIAEAVKAGATKEEILHSSMLTITMGGGPKLAHMNIVYEELDKYFK